MEIDGEGKKMQDSMGHFVVMAKMPFEILHLSATHGPFTMDWRLFILMRVDWKKKT